MPAKVKPKAKIVEMRPTMRVDDEKGLVDTWLVVYEMEPGYRASVRIDKDVFGLEAFAEAVRAQEKARLDAIGLEVEI